MLKRPLTFPLPFQAVVLVLVWGLVSLFVGDSALYVGFGLVSGGVFIWWSSAFYLNSDRWAAALDRRSTRGEPYIGSSSHEQVRNARARYARAFRVTRVLGLVVVGCGALVLAAAILG